MKKHRKKWQGIVLILAGAALIISALSLFIYNRYEDARAGDAAKDLLAEMDSIIQSGQDNSRRPKPVVIRETPPDKDEEEPPKEEMPVAQIGGYDCIGVLCIPKLSLKLPIMSEWDYHRLTIAPCRQFGSTKTDDLVIAGHNYTNHFGSLSSLAPGDDVIFTDLNGEVNNYEVTLTDTLAPAEVEAVKCSGHDLVLYTCTYSGKTRVTVFCDRKI